MRIQCNCTLSVTLKNWYEIFATCYEHIRFFIASTVPISCAVGKGADNAAAPGFRLQAFDPPPDVPAQRLAERHQLLTRLGQVGDSHTPTAAASMSRYQERALDLVTGPGARRAFDLGREPDKVRERYGRHPLGQNLLLARRLIEAGVRLVSVNAWAGVPLIHHPRFYGSPDLPGATIQAVASVHHGPQRRRRCPR